MYRKVEIRFGKTIFKLKLVKYVECKSLCQKLSYVTDNYFKNNGNNNHTDDSIIILLFSLQLQLKTAPNLKFRTLY